MESKVLAQKTLSEQGFRGRANVNPNGCFQMITEIMHRDPYFPLRHMIKLYPFYQAHAKEYDKTMQLLREDDEPVYTTINIWIMGKAGGGKTKIIDWFSRYCLDLEPFTPVQSENFKWWDGYVNEIVVHIEEMGPKNRMLIDRLKTLCDVKPIRIEMKGGVSRQV